jgi:Spy/CpxP family protein refolding chaperone
MHDLMTAKRFGTITPEQQKELDAHMAQRKTEMEKHMADRKAAMEARRKKGEEFHQQLLSILTPEQKAQLQKMHEEKMKQMQERMKNRPRRGPGGPPMGPGGPPPGGEGNF